MTLLPPLKQLISLKHKLPKLSIFNPQPPQISDDSDSDLFLPTPRETLEEIGDRLHQLRQQQQLSIDDIAARTQIQPRLVLAIEQGHIEMLPESVYVKGMIKRFGNSLGIDGSSLSQEVPDWNRQDFDFTQEQTLLQTTGFHHQTGARKTKSVNNQAGVQNTQGFSNSTAQVKPLHVYLGYTLAIVGVGAGISHLINSSIGSKHPNLNGSTESAPAAIVAKIPAVATPPKSARLPDVKVDILVKSPTWAQIGVDGTTKFTGNLIEGAQLNLVATKQVTISTSNAGGLVLSRDGQPLQPIGELGQKQHVTIKVGK